MANAQYLWSAARALRTRVRPAITDNAARDALDNSIRVLTTVANALEPGPALPDRYAALGGNADTDRLGGPAENLGAYPTTGNTIAHLAGNIAKGTDPTDLLAAVRWEKALLDDALGRIDAVERSEPTGDDGSAPSYSIDPARLQAYLRRRPGSENATVTDFRLIVGGRSRQTALFSVDNGGALPHAMVIQRGIPGQMVAAAFLDEARQYHLLEQLHLAGMRVPRPVLVETDPAWLDAAFLIVEQVSGSPVQSDYWLPAKEESVVIGLAEQMALLHAQPVEKLGEGLYDARARSDAASWLAEIDQLAAGWDSSAHWPSITMSAAIAWLRANIDCLDDRRVVVHNDMVFHNILAESGQITAVLDWEQCAIGHPGEDLGYCYPVVIAVTDWSKFMDAYRAAGGADIPQRQIDFFALRAGLRLMGLVLSGGRNTFENGLSDDVLVASAGAHFSQRLLHRVAFVLNSILERQ